MSKSTAKLKIAEPDSQPQPRVTNTVRIWQNGIPIAAHKITEDFNRPAIDTDEANSLKGAPVLCVWTEEGNFEYSGNIAWCIQYLDLGD